MKVFMQPLIAYALMMCYAALMGRERLIEYAVGKELVLVEEYLIILGLCYLYLIVSSVLRRVFP
jgi:hypothetical protein